MVTTVQKWGNGLGIRIPKPVAEQLNLKEGTNVVFATAGDVLTIRPRRKPRLALAQLLARAKGPSPHRGLDRGAPVGRELL